MTVLWHACVFPIVALGLQAFTTSRDKAATAVCEQKKHIKPPWTASNSDCKKILTPSLFFIGQAHSGSSSLSNLMELHPEIHSGDMKEHQFFNRGIGNKVARQAQNFSEYIDQFCVPCDTTVAFDATMAYIDLAYQGHGSYDSKMVEEVHNAMGSDIKIMIMLRDPVDLLFSSECQPNGAGERPFTVDKPTDITLTHQRVTEPLDVWLQVFPKYLNWLFLKSEDFFADPQSELDKVFRFLEVKPYKVPMDVRDDHGDLLTQTGRRRCAIKATTEDRRAYWSLQGNVKDKQRLEKITGLNFTWQES